MKNKDIKKDYADVIFKQDIMNEDGKLNIVGIFMFIALITACFNYVCNYLNDNIVDKDKVC